MLHFALCDICEVDGITIAQLLNTPDQQDIAKSRISYACIDYIFT